MRLPFILKHELQQKKLLLFSTNYSTEKTFTVARIDLFYVEI